VINWMSFAGQTDVPLFTYNFFDKPFWESPEQWLKQSPLMYVGNVTTPTVVIRSARSAHPCRKARSTTRR
jgi:dipeptidyl aminopeptidase/acylaminoacyl peptidase